MSISIVSVGLVVGILFLGMMAVPDTAPLAPLRIVDMARADNCVTVDPVTGNVTVDPSCINNP